MHILFLFIIQYEIVSEKTYVGVDEDEDTRNRAPDNIQTHKTDPRQ